ncbi:bacilysin biosynthesis protein BacB [bacterium BMS3Abin03]|nr:bacilysin biosynthesis protein BacB [bacterium BMS3Abin03]
MPIIDLETIEKKELLPGYKVRFVHSDNLTIAFWDVKAGSKLPAHSHVHEQVSQIIEGEFELTVDGNTFVLKQGKVAIIPSNVEHSGKAITDCKIVDTFYPLREDYM